MSGFEVTKLEGDNGQAGFRFVSKNHPCPTAGLDVLVAASRRPRVMKAADPPAAIASALDPGSTVASVVDKARSRVQATDLTATSKAASGTTFGRVLADLRAQGPA